MKIRNHGFSLLELTVVIAIIAFLSMMVMPRLMTFLAKAKRSEAYIQLRSLYLQEKMYWAENGTYTSIIGNGGLGWRPEGTPNYTYGFPGSPGTNHVTGALHGGSLQGGYASKTGFKIVATCDIDGDGEPDTLTIDENGTITLVNDDLQ